MTLLAHKTKILGIAAALLFCGAAAPPLSAQVVPPGLEGLDPLALSLSTRFPAPGQAVTATLSSSAINLDEATVLWSINGARAAEKNGHSIRFTAGDVGKTERVAVSVTTSAGYTVFKEASVTPARVDMLWQAASYAPPFYRGKALPGTGSSIVVYALPELRAGGAKVSSSNLVFTWEQNGRVLGSLSGRGKDTITLPGPEVYRDFALALTVTTLDGTAGAYGSLRLPAAQPFVLFYEDHPTLGVRLESALSSEFSLSGGEVTLSAQPYFFDAERPDDAPLSYRWSINDAAVENPGADPSKILLRPTSEGAGSASVRVTVEHAAKIFQQAGSALTVRFGEAQGASLF